MLRSYFIQNKYIPHTNNSRDPSGSTAPSGDAPQFGNLCYKATGSPEGRCILHKKKDVCTRRTGAQNYPTRRHNPNVRSCGNLPAISLSWAAVTSQTTVRCRQCVLIALLLERDDGIFLSLPPFVTAGVTLSPHRKLPRSGLVRCNTARWDKTWCVTKYGSCNIVRNVLIF
jgi:hypothetical protein